TRRARTLAPELLDLVPLLLHFVVLLEQIGAAGGRVFLLPHPRRPLLFGGLLGDLEPLAERRRFALHPGERLRRRRQLRDAAVQRHDGPHQLRQLPFIGAAGRLFLLEVLELGLLALQPLDRLELGAPRVRPVASVQRFRQLPVAPLPPPLAA